MGCVRWHETDNQCSEDNISGDGAIELLGATTAIATRCSPVGVIRSKCLLLLI